MSGNLVEYSNQISIKSNQSTQEHFTFVHDSKTEQKSNQKLDIAALCQNWPLFLCALHSKNTSIAKPLFFWVLNGTEPFHNTAVSSS